MAIDLTGGLDPRFEHFLGVAPDDPGMRESATIWVMDQKGEIAFPRITIDAIGAHWSQPWAQMNMVLADGRAFRLWEQMPTPVSPGPIGEGEATVLAAGPLRFACVEPYAKWEITFDGEIEQTTTLAQMAGETGGTRVPLAFRFFAEMVASPWLMGGLSPEAASQMQAGPGAEYMGGLRYEQLCRITGWVRIDGSEHEIDGTGMRVRRRGVRNMAQAPGHCQHTALFPSGRGFGANAFVPAADGSQAFNEAFVMLEDGRRLSARLKQAPWMKRLSPSAEDATIVLETDEVDITVTGETLLKVFDRHWFEMADTSVLQQGTARYCWNGEETIGLIERCTLHEQLGGFAKASAACEQGWNHRDDALACGRTRESGDHRKRSRPRLRADTDGATRELSRSAGGRAARVAAAIAYFVSEAAGYTTGQVWASMAAADPDDRLERTSG